MGNSKQLVAHRPKINAEETSISQFPNPEIFFSAQSLLKANVRRQKGLCGVMRTVPIISILQQCLYEKQYRKKMVFTLLHLPAQGGCHYLRLQMVMILFIHGLMY